MDTPYRVEPKTRLHAGIRENTYCITRTGEDDLAYTKDIVFAHKIVELLNEEENGRDVHR